eukprot:scaffold492_cov257-Pinguiococcus_pyrenoidosus.AAC.14
MRTAATAKLVTDGHRSLFFRADDSPAPAWARDAGEHVEVVELKRTGERIRAGQQGGELS